MKKFFNNQIKLNLQFNTELLLADFNLCLIEKWKEHFNSNDYDGSWTAISLRSPSGNVNDILAHNFNEPFKNTELLSKCNYFKLILDDLKFEKETVRILRLAPGSVVKPHRDMGLAYRFGSFRLHIPVITDALIDFVVNDQKIEMRAGECWYADFDQQHSVSNKSSRERVHLVVDGKRNGWTDNLFTASGYDFEEEKNMLDYSKDTKLKMIEQLRLMKTDTANEMIAKLEFEIKANENSNYK